MYKALTIAGSDSGGGAGIQADLKTFSAFGVYGMSAITSITAQNTTGVYKIFDLPGSLVYEQIKVVYEDIGIDASKLGMLSNEDIILNVAKAIRDFKLEKIVLDPVMISKSGSALLQKSAIEALIREIVPFSLIITPNLNEAKVISNIEIKNINDMKECAKIIRSFGAKCVIIKGGHLNFEKEVIDIIYYDNEFIELSYPIVNTRNTHGTGCTFSAAITANLAKGKGILDSIRIAKAYTQLAIENNLNIGKGYGPLGHFLSY
ncbi:MAG: bifunctional hydroxymethylpyrimidine kinase/phosphomethylpyrimidine kinase [candidate division WOR-3 bacterium]